MLSGSCTRRGQRGWSCSTPDRSWRIPFLTESPHFFSYSVRIFSEVSDSVHAAHCAGPSPQSQDVNRAASLCKRHDWVAARVVLHLRPHTLLEGGAGAGGSCEETFGECEPEDGWSETSADLSRFSRAEAGPSFPIQCHNVSRSCKRTQHRGMLV